MSDIKLNIGAGDTVIDGYTAIDRRLGTEAYPLQYEDNSVSDIRASHILEHFTFKDGQQALKEWVRVLKPGGRIRLAVPDFDYIVKERQDTDPEQQKYWRFHLMGGQTDDNDIHASVYDRSLLTQTMLQCGLVDIKKWQSDNTDTASAACSLNLEGVKPAVDAKAKHVDIKIQALMSVPRYGSMSARGVIESALKPFGMGLSTSQGVFWGQCMQRMFEECVEKGIDWILAIDFDSVFTDIDLDRLMGTLGNNPHIDAVAALQCRRANKTPLMTVGNNKNVTTDGTPIKVTTAHFGLTLIRVEVLKEIEKPWFYAEPEKGGTWGDERLDDDIWFWHQWRLAGKNIYVDPTVRIGHVEECVSYFDEKMEPQLVAVTKWRDKFIGKGQ